MLKTLQFIVVALLAAPLGILIYELIRRAILKKKADEIIRNAEVEGENIKKEKIVQAKEKFLQLKSEHEEAIKEKNNQIAQVENRLRQKESQLGQQKGELDRKIKENDQIKDNLQKQLEILNKKKDEYEKMREDAIRKLEEVAGMTAEDAKEQLMESMKAEAKTQAMGYINDVMDEARLTASKEAKRIVINTIQRTAPEVAIENAVTVFNIDNDEVKGRIIGREGRNIRALEAAIGVEIVVDDTPEAILISAFDPVRREVARLALHQLVADGRIHPARIEEVVAKVSKQLDEEIMEIGKRTCIDLGVHGLNSQLVKMVGRMKYRSSYGQNLLQHSREVANISAILAAELGLNPKVAKRAGLLHDIGKVAEEEYELPHAIVGMQIAEKCKEKPEVCNAIGAHHEEIEMQTLIAPIVLVADAISGSRPGARREVIESYIKRLKDMENIAASHQGVVKAYAIQAGRELRVIVGADQVSDAECDEISAEVARRIQDEMTYPGQVKVTVIREVRSVAFAK